MVLLSSQRCRRIHFCKLARVPLMEAGVLCGCCFSGVQEKMLVLPVGIQGHLSLSASPPRPASSTRTSQSYKTPASLHPSAYSLSTHAVTSHSEPGNMPESRRESGILASLSLCCSSPCASSSPTWPSDRCALILRGLSPSWVGASWPFCGALCPQHWHHTGIELAPGNICGLDNPTDNSSLQP